MQLLRNPGWLLGCCNAVARVSGSVARMLLCGARVPGVVAIRLLWYSGWLLRCCYAVAMVPGWLLGCCYAVARDLGRC